MLVAVLPDLDFLLGGFGIQHRTWAHSIFIWTLLFTPFILKFKLDVVPYYVAAMQHMLFGDAIVGLNTPFWPVSNSSFGFNLDALSLQNVIAEEVGLSTLITWLLLDSKTRQSFLYFGQRKFGLVICVMNLAALVGFTASIYYYGSVLEALGTGGIIMHPSQLEKNASMITYSALFPAEISMHGVLIGLICTSLFYNYQRRLSLVNKTSSRAD